MCEKGYNEKVGAFTQYYGSDQLDASVLMIPLVGFLPPTDPRVVSTVEAVERELLEDGFVLRYRTADDGAVDGLTGREGAFLACSFWLVDCLHMIGRTEDAEKLFERLLAPAQRSRPPVRGVRPDRRPVGRQLPPGLLPCVPGQFGLPAERPRHAGHRGRRAVAGAGASSITRVVAAARPCRRPRARKRARTVTERRTRRHRLKRKDHT